MPDIQTVAVIGAGGMGNGIAHAAARGGFRVLLHDIERRSLDRAMSTIEQNLQREVAKGRITADDKRAALSRIAVTAENSVLIWDPSCPSK